jgi:hypothetical protein
MDHSCGAVLWWLAMDRDRDAHEGKTHKIYQDRLSDQYRSRA